MANKRVIESVIKTYLLVTVTIFTLISCKGPSQRRPSSQTSEELVAKIIQEAVPESQKTEIKQLGENMLRYILDASFKDDQEKLLILANAEEYFNKVSYQILLNVKAISNGEEEELFKVKKVPQWSVKAETQWLNTFAKELPSPPASINFELVLDSFSKLDPRIVESLADAKPNNLKNSFEILKSLHKSDGNKLLAAMKLAEEQIQAQIDDFQERANGLSKSDEIKFNQPFWEKSVKEFISEYFQRTDVEVFKNMISDVIALGHQPTEKEAISIIFSNAGPGLGKTLQQIGREEGMGEGLADLMSQLESDGKPVPFHIAKEIIENDPAGYTFKSIDPEPIGTGTIAQVHRAIAIIEGSEVEVAVRFLKPSIKERALDDIRILKIVFERMKNSPDVKGMDIPDLDKLLKTLDEFLSSDINIEQTLLNHEFALNVYSKLVKVKLEGSSYLLDFKAPELYLPSDPEMRSQTGLVVTEFIEGGSKFSQVEDLKVKKVVAQEVMRLWVEEALFRTGYTHADLHEGNFKVILVDDGKKIDIRFFDFGMNLHVSKETRRAFILIGAGAAYSDPRLVAKALLAFGNNSKNLSERQLSKIISKELTLNGAKDQAGWVTWGIRNGFQIPDDLGVLTRGGALLNQLPTSVGRKGIEVGFVEQFAIKYKAQRFINRRFAYPLTHLDILQVGTSMAKYKCINFMKKLFKTK